MLTVTNNMLHAAEIPQQKLTHRKHNQIGEKERQTALQRAHHQETQANPQPKRLLLYQDNQANQLLRASTNLLQ